MRQRQWRLEASKRRANPTPPERILAEAFEQGRLGRYPAYREYEICGYFADFYVPAARLAIEVDGSQHQTRRLKDDFRDGRINAHGDSIIRVPATRIFNQLERVISEVGMEIDAGINKQKKLNGFMDSDTQRNTKKRQSSKQALKVLKKRVFCLECMQAVNIVTSGSQMCPQCGSMSNRFLGSQHAP